MDHRYDIITFDCYGTLIDWEAGIGAAFLEAARRDGVVLGREEVLRVYAELEPVVETECYRRYREVLRETALRVAERLGWGLSPERATFLAESLPQWPPFPDTNPALERLAAGCRLGILSNVDDDLLAGWNTPLGAKAGPRGGPDPSGTLRHLTVPFDLRVTAEQVGSYKPAPGHFLTARERIGDRRWLHAAQSWFHDIAPALALGVPAVWINRKGETAPDGLRPLHEVRTLAELADWLG